MASGAYLITLIDNFARSVDNLGRVKPCQPRARCGLWRSCPVCSKIRQARAADAAERLLGPAGPVMLTVAQPNLGESLNVRTIKQIAQRALGADRGFWSIEASRQKGGLHINLITPLSDYMQPGQIRMHSEICAAPTRAVAAYCVKPDQSPTEEEYSGRLYGTWGNVLQALAGKGPAPELRAYAAECEAERIISAAATEAYKGKTQAELADLMASLRDRLRQ